jgi:hypothetical protein
MNPSSQQRPALRVTHILTAGLLAAGLSASASAGAPSSFAESRGYQNCVDAASASVQLLDVDSTYYIYDHEDARNFYLNGYARAAGRSEPVKIACQTTRSGHRLLSVSVDNGRYAGRVAESVEIASN